MTTKADRILEGRALVDALVSAAEQREVELPGGVVLQVRSLTKVEQGYLAALDPENKPVEFQMSLFRMGVVGELSEEDVQAIFDQAPAGLIDKVIAAILEVSGQENTFRQGDEDRNGAGK